MKTYINIILILGLFLSNVSSQSIIDILELKNGDIIKGKIIENKINQYVRIELKGGSIITYEYDKIDTIKKEDISEQQSSKMIDRYAIEDLAISDAKQDYKLFGDEKIPDGWYSFGGTFIATMLTGASIGGNLGMAASYLMSGNNPEIPSHRLNSASYMKYDDDEKSIYDNWYKIQATKTIKTKSAASGFSGCVTGYCFFIILFILIANGPI